MTVSIINHNHMTDSNLEESGRMFNAKSILDITAYIEKDAIDKVRDEVNSLTKEFGLRRDLTIKTTDYTPRRMNNVDYDTIAERSSLLMDIYADPHLLKLLAQIVGEDVHPCP